MELPDVAYFGDVPVGYVEESGPIEVRRDEMIAYARVNDPWPIHVDQEVARESIFGDVIASFGYTVSIFFRLAHMMRVNQVSQAAFLGGLGWQVRFRGAVKAGDQLRLRSTVISNRLTSRGDRGVVTSLCEMINQDDVPVVDIEIASLALVRPGTEPT
jgi:acyl dehydratase